MNARDLITLQNVKDWLNTSGVTYPTTSDALISRLVTAVSLFAGSYLQRQLQPASYSDVYNGLDTTSITLKNNPVISVASVTIGTSAILPRTGVGSSGYVFDASSLFYDGGGRFCRGIQNVAVSYKAGYQTADMVTVPATPYIVSVTALSRAWNSDQGVTYASSGAALTPVSVSPTVTGTYQVKADTSGTAEYVFAAGDTGASVFIMYGYTPEDVVQALVEMVGESYKRRERIGEVSKVIGPGTTVSFSRLDMNESIRTLLNPYRQVVPIQ